MRFLVAPKSAGDRAELGGKAASLAILTSAGFPVPGWFVVTPRAFDASLAGQQRAVPAIAGLRVAPDIEVEVQAAIRMLGGERDLFAVRSSAIDEDSERHSFAGQLESYLFVSARDVPRRIADVWRSAFSERVAAYRREHRLGENTNAPAVIVQRMVNADASGVAFSADPVTGERDVAVVGSISGVATALVSGDADADTHRVDTRGRIVERRVVAKSAARHAVMGGGPGASTGEVKAERARRAVLSDEQIMAVAALARRAETLFAHPQDIEWAIAGGRLHILQSRPITSLPAGSRGALAIWDNSNIAESYGGLTTPLTFTFVRNAYAGVYEQLCRIFGVPSSSIERNRDALDNMLGLIQGRIYYNLANWYRLLATLPGYCTNRAFFEQMIGVNERAPDELFDQRTEFRWHERAIDAMHVARMAAGVLAAYVTIRVRMRRFYRRVDDAVNTGDLAMLPLDELTAEYRRLERRLISRWDAPQVNDFFAMVFYGILRRLCLRWCGDADGTLQNGLLSGTGGLVSTEPAERVEAMAAISRRHDELGDALRTASVTDACDVIARYPEFAARYQGYLDKFGDRCVDELKLESPTLHENPLMLLRSIGFLAEQHVRASAGSTRATTRADSERRARAALGWNPLRRMLFTWVLGNARRFVRGRENMRLQRTRVFARVRAIFVQIGRRLAESGALDEPRDVFYMTMDEIMGYVSGAAVTTDLRALVALRRAEFARFAQMEAPPDRFETRGVNPGGSAFRAQDSVEEADGNARSGIGCCPGRVQGRVRVVLDPANVTLRRGDILVAERTDPSWVMLFPFARGLLVERGSLLSHSAIVSREMGIPSVVSIPGLTRWLKDGDWVEFNGATGVVERIDRRELA